MIDAEQKKRYRSPGRKEMSAQCAGRLMAPKEILAGAKARKALLAYGVGKQRREVLAEARARGEWL